MTTGFYPVDLRGQMLIPNRASYYHASRAMGQDVSFVYIA
jgi:hypothetical protein